MWLDKICELKKKSGKTKKCIADYMHKSERTVGRFLSGETDFTIDEVRKLVLFLDGDLNDVFAESDFKIPTPEVEALKKEIADLTSKIEELTAGENLLKAENDVLKAKISALAAETDVLRLTLAHKDEIIALHNYYNKLTK